MLRRLYQEYYLRKNYVGLYVSKNMPKGIVVYRCCCKLFSAFRWTITLSLKCVYKISVTLQSLRSTTVSFETERRAICF